jgi:spore coat protein CotF
MKFTDMDMLQDYEKDARMAVIAYSIMATETLDPALRQLFQTMSSSANESQARTAQLILKKGDRP